MVELKMSHTETIIEEVSQRGIDRDCCEWDKNTGLIYNSEIYNLW